MAKRYTNLQTLVHNLATEILASTADLPGKPAAVILNWSPGNVSISVRKTVPEEMISVTHQESWRDDAVPSTVPISPTEVAAMVAESRRRAGGGGCSGGTCGC